MQDLLQLGAESRMNLPGTVGGNWDWRMTSDAITNDVREKLLAWTITYFRKNNLTIQQQEATAEKEALARIAAEDDIKEELSTEKNRD